MSTPSFADPLAYCRFDCKQRPKEATPVYYVGEVPICTPGNLSTILAQPKAGKTAFIGAMIAATLKRDGVICDTFSITSRNPEGFALLHFDTEQSPSDHWDVISCAMRRAQVTEQPPWLLSYCLTGSNAVNANQMVLAQIQRTREVFGGVHSVIIDGYADLVLDVNDAKESSLLVTELHKFSIAAYCPIIGVLHYNPGSEKGRGHLGSQLERRAETNLALQKTGTLTEVWSDKQRKEPIPKGQGPCFAWNAEAHMHLSVESTHNIRHKAKLAEAQEQAKSVFGSREKMRYGELKNGVIAMLGKSESTSERKIKDWRRVGVITKNLEDLWVLTT